MYATKRFRARPTAETVAEVEAMATHPWRPRKLFLGDGDALALSNRRLLPLLEAIGERLPWVTRVSCYATPANLLHKSLQELEELRSAGLRLVYLGIESGCDAVLARVDKGASRDDTVAALQLAGAAGMKRSVMIINGLGGARFSSEHAAASAAVLNATQPEYASVLALLLPDAERFSRAFGSDWSPLDDRGLLVELRRLLAATALRRTLFRSNHASNLLALAGTLDRDRERLLDEIDARLDGAGGLRLRPRGSRRL
jgi:radical SAM superfamily enzyme YgiQ (UPF0313 family)